MSNRKKLTDEEKEFLGEFFVELVAVLSTGFIKKYQIIAAKTIRFEKTEGNGVSGQNFAKLYLELYLHDKEM